MWKTQQLVSPCQKVGQEGEYLLVEGERERRQLAQKLHDGPIQHLIYISYQLVEDRRCFEQELNPDLQTQHAEIMAPTLEDIRREVLDVVTQLRQLMGELDCAGLEKVGLTTALERYVLRLDCKEALELKLDLAENETDLPEPVAICLFRVAQQALHNVLQHAQARYAKLTLRFLEDEVILKVYDDGRGLHLPVNLNELARTGHLGLVGMAERVAWAGGQLVIQSELGEGTEVTVGLPLK